jgi:hypothetical protein
MKEVIKNKVIEIHQLTEGNVIFVGSISSYFNKITNEIKDIDIVLKDKTYFSQLEILGEIKSFPNPSNLFGENVERYYIENDVTIDIFVNNEATKTEIINIDKHNINIVTLESQINHYKELLQNPIEKEEHRIKLKNKLTKIYLAQNNFSPKQLDKININ